MLKVWTNYKATVETEPERHFGIKTSEKDKDDSPTDSPRNVNNNNKKSVRKIMQQANHKKPFFFKKYGAIGPLPERR